MKEVVYIWILIQLHTDPYHKYRSFSTVLGYEIKSKDLICNAVMMTAPISFFKLWLERYEGEFKEDGWGETSIRIFR